MPSGKVVVKPISPLGLVQVAPRNLTPALSLGGAIAGRITDTKTAKGISDAFVDIYDGNTNQLVTSVDTNASGYYTSTKSLPTGGYKIIFRSVKHFDEYFHHKSTLASADMVNVTAPSVTQNIAQSLVPCSERRKAFLPIVYK